eukprot:4311771-Amphidinium_carterae.1
MAFDHNAAMQLRKWHNEDSDTAMANSRITMRIGTGTDVQWTSPVTIMNSQITVQVDNNIGHD